MVCKRELNSKPALTRTGKPLIVLTHRTERDLEQHVWKGEWGKEEEGDQSLKALDKA